MNFCMYAVYIYIIDLQDLQCLSLISTYICCQTICIHFVCWQVENRSKRHLSAVASRPRCLNMLKILGAAGIAVGLFVILRELYNRIRVVSVRGKVVLITGASSGLGEG